LASAFSRGFYGRVALSRAVRNGFFSPRAEVIHSAFVYGEHCYVDDRVVIYEDNNGGEVRLGNGVHLHRDTIIQTGAGGNVVIGDGSHVQSRCQLSAYVASIVIGERAEIAPACAFYSYDHSIAAGTPVRDQPLTTRGGITMGDDVWLGYGVIVLDGVHIGDGAVVGAGSLVNRDIPAGSVAVGSPAKVVRNR
jgi:acetyltransferase-like isoleucine patch superfamily enzyme